MGGTFSPALLASAQAVPDSWIIAITIAKALFGLASLALFVRVMLFLRKRHRLVNEILREVADDQPFVTLPDDGQTITVHANTSGVRFYVIRLTLVMGVFTAGGVWMSIDPRYQVGVVLIAFLDLVLGVFLVLGIARLISRAPVLIVNSEGTSDNATLIATGMGLIPWREILGFQILSGSQNRSARVLTIVADDHTILREQAFWKRALLILLGSPYGVVRIREFLLPMPLEALQAQIEEYVRVRGHTLLLSHAPAGADTSTSAG